MVSIGGPSDLVPSRCRTHRGAVEAGPLQPVRRYYACKAFPATREPPSLRPFNVAPFLLPLRRHPLPGAISGLGRTQYNRGEPFTTSQGYYGCKAFAVTREPLHPDLLVGVCPTRIHGICSFRRLRRISQNPDISRHLAIHQLAEQRESQSGWAFPADRGVVTLRSASSRQSGHTQRTRSS